MMNRRSFFKALIGVAGAIVVGVPKTQAEVPPIPKEIDSSARILEINRKIAENSTYGALGAYKIIYKGFEYTYSPRAYQRMMQIFDARKRACGIGNSESLRTYSAEKIVRISDGKVFKDRKCVPGTAYASPEEFEAFYRGKFLS